MEKDREIRISQCMIVKNEEANIEKALSWGRDLVWEQIVVDTGSTDRTVEIAASMGAAVYHFPWIDDFAAAKNFAISKAKGEWIAFLDADESFPPEDARKIPGILKQLASTRTQAVITGCMLLDETGAIRAGGTQIRIFRNLPGFGYRRRIHEQLGWLDGSPMHVADATGELAVLHTGYCQTDREKKTASGRNLRLLLKELEEHPGDHELMGYLGDEYYGADQYEEAEAWYRKAVAAMPELLDSRDQRSATTFLFLMEIMEQRQESETEILAVYQKAEALLPEEPDFDYVIGSYYAAKGAFADGSIYLERAIEKLEKYGCNNRAMMLAGHLYEAYEKLALCCLRSGVQEKAVQYSVSVLKSQPYSMQILCILLQAFRGDDSRPSVQPVEAAAFLGKLYRPDVLKDRLFLLKAAAGIGWGELERLIEKWFTPEELEYIKKHGEVKQ